MLLFVRFLATGQSFSFDVRPQGPVQQLVDLLTAQLPRYIVRRLLFAGRVLQWDRTIASYALAKENVITAMGDEHAAISANAVPIKPAAAANANAIASANSNQSLALPPPTVLRRNITDAEVSYGEALLVQLIRADDLNETEYWSATSNPYAVLALGQSSARSGIREKTLHPVWNEWFGLYVPSPAECAARDAATVGAGSKTGVSASGDQQHSSNAQSGNSSTSVKTAVDKETLLHQADQLNRERLSVLLFSHHLKGDDDDVALGQYEAPLSDIPVGSLLDYDGKLKHVHTGRVTLRMGRYALSSPSMRQAFLSLVADRRCLTESRMAEVGLSFRVLTGAQPYTLPGATAAPVPVALLSPASERKHSQDFDSPVHQNPALLHLASLLRTGALSRILRNPRTLARVTRILTSQRIVGTADPPSRSLLIFYADLSTEQRAPNAGASWLPPAGAAGTTWLHTPPRVSALFHWLQTASDGSLRCLRIVPLSSGCLDQSSSATSAPPLQADTCCVVATFKSAESCLLALASMDPHVVSNAGLRFAFGDADTLLKIGAAGGVPMGPAADEKQSDASSPGTILASNVEWLPQLLMVGTARWSVERVTSRDKRVTPLGVRVWSPADGKLPDSGKAGKGGDKSAPIAPPKPGPALLAPNQQAAEPKGRKSPSASSKTRTTPTSTAANTPKSRTNAKTPVASEQGADDPTSLFSFGAQTEDSDWTSGVIALTHQRQLVLLSSTAATAAPVAVLKCEDWHVHRQGPWSLQLRPVRAGDADCIYYLRFDYDSAESDGNRQLKLWHKLLSLAAQPQAQPGSAASSKPAVNADQSAVSKKNNRRRRKRGPADKAKAANAGSTPITTGPPAKAASDKTSSTAVSAVNSVKPEAVPAPGAINQLERQLSNGPGRVCPLNAADFVKSVQTWIRQRADLASLLNGRFHCARCEQQLPLNQLCIIDSQDGRENIVHIQPSSEPVTEKAPISNAPAAAVAGGSAGNVVIAPSVAHNFKGFFPDQPTLARLPTVARGGFACRSCLNIHLSNMHTSDRLKDAFESYSLQDMKDILGPAVFAVLLDKSTMLHIKEQADYMKCPNAACALAFAPALHSNDSASENATKELGLDKRPLSASAQLHFLEHRFYCRGCHSNFCSKCRRIPYHLGFTCDEYAEFLVAPKCRFCDMPVTDRNRMKHPASDAVRQVCDSEGCVAAARMCCVKPAPCGVEGHWCNEVEHGAAPCPPCLQDGKVCEEKRKAAGGTMAISDMCSICSSEELRSGACATLSCGHVFHYLCVAKQLKEVPLPGQRIVFNNCMCPLCHQYMQHSNPVLQSKIDVFTQLKTVILSDLPAHIQEDKLDEDPRVQDAHSPFYNKVTDLALDTYSYYLCRICKSPFFGGKRACDAAGQAEARALACGTCEAKQTAKGLVCIIPAHKEYIVYKCRFCCSAAVWFCFGNTHFCEYCHSHDPWGRAEGKVVDERAQCPPPGKTECPLGLEVGSHSNGKDVSCELSIYCGMCRDVTGVHGPAPLDANFKPGPAIKMKIDPAVAAVALNVNAGAIPAPGAPVNALRLMDDLPLLEPDAGHEEKKFPVAAPLAAVRAGAPRPANACLMGACRNVVSAACATHHCAAHCPGPCQKHAKGNPAAR